MHTSGSRCLGFTQMTGTPSGPQRKGRGGKNERNVASLFSCLHPNKCLTILLKKTIEVFLQRKTLEKQMTNIVFSRTFIRVSNECSPCKPTNLRKTSNLYFFMRNSTFRKFLLFLLLLPTLLCTTAWAQLSTLEQGKVYRFKNVGQSSYALAATTTKGATGSTATTGSTQADYPQLWYVAEVKDVNGTACETWATASTCKATGRARSGKW